MNHVKFIEDSLYEISGDMLFLSRLYHFKCSNAAFHKFYMVCSRMICPECKLQKHATCENYNNVTLLVSYTKSTLVWY